jgi:hypothetical protein
VPSGLTIVVRDLLLFNNSGDDALVTVEVHVSGSVGNIYGNTGFKTVEWFHWAGRAVIEADGELWGASSNDAVRAIISGYSLGAS